MGMSRLVNVICYFNFYIPDESFGLLFSGAAAKFVVEGSFLLVVGSGALACGAVVTKVAGDAVGMTVGDGAAVFVHSLANQVLFVGTVGGGWGFTVAVAGAIRFLLGLHVLGKHCLHAVHCDRTCLLWWRLVWCRLLCGGLVVLERVVAHAAVHELLDLGGCWGIRVGAC